MISKSLLMTFIVGSLFISVGTPCYAGFHLPMGAGQGIASGLNDINKRQAADRKFKARRKDADREHELRMRELQYKIDAMEAEARERQLQEQREQKAYQESQQESQQKLQQGLQQKKRHIYKHYK